MAAITFDDQAPWIVARWAFRQLLALSSKVASDNPGLGARLEAAEALDGLHFGRLQHEEARMVAEVLLQASRELVAELEASDVTDPRRPSFVEAHRELQKRLELELSELTLEEQRAQ